MNVDVPNEIHQKFKAWCLLNGLSLKAGIIKVMIEKGDQVSLTAKKE